jgi:hypothetical protein
MLPTKKTFTLTLSFCLFAASVSALDVTTYRKLSQDPAEAADLNAHLEGFAAGVTYANAMLSTSGRRPIYCSPNKFTLNVKNLRDLMDTKIEDYLKSSTETEVGRLDAEALLLVALIEAFPCKAAGQSKKAGGE